MLPLRAKPVLQIQIEDLLEGRLQRKIYLRLDQVQFLLRGS